AVDRVTDDAAGRYDKHAAGEDDVTSIGLAGRNSVSLAAADGDAHKRLLPRYQLQGWAAPKPFPESSRRTQISPASFDHRRSIVAIPARPRPHFVFGRGLHRKVGRFGAAQDADGDSPSTEAAWRRRRAHSCSGRAAQRSLDL